MANRDFSKIRRTMQDFSLGVGEGSSEKKSIEVEDIENMTSEQCEALKAGDVVIDKNDNGDFTHIVTLKGEDVLELTYIDNTECATVSYSKTEEEWACEGTEVTELGSGGEDKKYLHMIYIHAGSCDYIDVNLNLTISRAEPFTDNEDFNGWLREKGMVVSEEYIEENDPTFTGITCNVLIGNAGAKAVLKGTCIDGEYENKLVFDTFYNYQGEVFVHDYDYTILDNVIEA